MSPGIFRRRSGHNKVMKLRLHSNGLTATPAAHTMAIFHEMFGTRWKPLPKGTLSITMSGKSVPVFACRAHSKGRTGRIARYRHRNRTIRQTGRRTRIRCLGSERNITVSDCKRKIKSCRVCPQHEANTGGSPDSHFITTPPYLRPTNWSRCARIPAAMISSEDNRQAQCRPPYEIRMFRNYQTRKSWRLDMLSTGVDIPPLNLSSFTPARAAFSGCRCLDGVPADVPKSTKRNSSSSTA